MLDASESLSATLRFTGWGATEGAYAYTEDGSAKTVTLQQYNYNTVDERTKYPSFNMDVPPTCSTRWMVTWLTDHKAGDDDSRLTLRIGDLIGLYIKKLMVK